MPPPRWRWGLQYVPYGWVARKPPLGRSAPGAPPARRGSPFLPRNGEKEGRGQAPWRNGEKEGRGQAPWTPGFYGRSFPLAGFGVGWLWYGRRAVASGMLKPIWDAFFGGKYAGKHFCERRFPNQAHPPKAFPLGGRCPSAHTGADEGATGLPNGAGEERRRGDRSLLLQGKVGYRIAPSSVTFGDSFPPRGSLRRCYTPATQFILARPLLPQNANPNQGTYMGTVIVPRPEQCGTIAKTSECQRAGH